MRIFIYEFTCAVSLEQNRTARDLQDEGLAILSAVAPDFSLLPRVEVVCLVSERVVRRLPFQAAIYLATDKEDPFEKLAGLADFTLVTAPESSGILLNLCQRVEQCGGRLLGPASQAIALAGDKLRLADALNARGVPVPATVPASRRADLDDGSFPMVVKPRYGAGAQDCYLLHNRSQLADCLAELRRRYELTDLVVQPYVQGQPASVTFLANRDNRVALVPAIQEIRIDGRIRYVGGRIPLDERLCHRAVELAGRAIQDIPGLSGYFGVDLVLGEPADGSQDRVIELNARLTTSYIGLRALAKSNLAEAMLQAAQQQTIPQVGWNREGVRFWPDGRVERTTGIGN